MDIEKELKSIASKYTTDKEGEPQDKVTRNQKALKKAGDKLRGKDTDEENKLVKKEGKEEKFFGTDAPADPRTEQEFGNITGQSRKNMFSQFENKQSVQSFSGWGNDHITMGLAQKTGRSFNRGLMTAVEGVSADLIDLIALPFGFTETKLSNWIREGTEDVKDANLTRKAAELQDFDWGDLGSMEFWMTGAAEQLPVIASYLIPSAGGARLATGLTTRLAKKALKRSIKRAGKKSLAKGSKVNSYLGGDPEKFMTFGKKGLIDMKYPRKLAAMAGGGAVSNVMVGASVANQTKKELLDLGYTKEQAAAAASDAFWDNSLYIGIDMISWGVQFGSLGKTAKVFNQSLDAAKKINNKVGRSLARAAINTAKVGSATAIEGMEEQFQEVYEEWVARKNVAIAQGKEYMDYWDFFSSDEMKETRALAGGMGALFGGAGNVVSAIAERKAYIDSKARAAEANMNMEAYTENQRQNRLEQTIASAIINGDEEGLASYWATLENREEMSPEEIEKNVELTNQMIQEYNDAVKASENKEGGLNLAGANVLMAMNVHNRSLDRGIAEEKEAKAEAIKFKAANGATQEVQDEIALSYDQKIGALEKEKKVIAELKRALISGKKDKLLKKDGIQINPDTNQLEIDNKIVENWEEQELGLSEESFNAYRKEGDGPLAGEAKGFLDKMGNFFKSKKPGFEKGAKGIKSAYDKVTSMFQGGEGQAEFAEVEGVGFARSKDENKKGQISLFNTNDNTPLRGNVIVQKTNPQGQTVSSELEGDLKFNEETGEYFVGEDKVEEKDFIDALRDSGANVNDIMAQLDPEKRKAFQKQKAKEEAEAKAKEAEEAKANEDEEGKKEEDDKGYSKKEQAFLDDLEKEIESEKTYFESLDEQSAIRFLKAIADKMQGHKKKVKEKVVNDFIEENLVDLEEKRKEEAEAKAKESKEKAEKALKKLEEENLAKARRNLQITLSNRMARYKYYQKNYNEVRMVDRLNDALMQKFSVEDANELEKVHVHLLLSLGNRFGGDPKNAALAIGSSVFLTRGYTKNKTFYHEMAHVIYTLFNNKPEIKKFVNDIIEKKPELIDKLKKEYKDKIQYDLNFNEAEYAGTEYYKDSEDGKWKYLETGNEVTQDVIIQELEQQLEGDDNWTLEQLNFALENNGMPPVENMEDIKKYKPGTTVKERPMEDQHDIRHEIFAHALEHSTARNYDIFFNKADENLRAKALAKIPMHVRKLFPNKQAAANWSGAVTEEALNENLIFDFYQEAKNEIKEAAFDEEARASKSNDPDQLDLFDSEQWQEKSDEILEQIAKLEERFKASEGSSEYKQEEDVDPELDPETEENVDFQKKEKFSGNATKIINTFIFENNSTVEGNEYTSKSTLEAYLMTTAAAAEVENFEDFKAQLKGSPMGPLKNFYQFMTQSFGDNSDLVLKSFYSEFKSVDSLPLNEVYVDEKTGRIYAQESLGPRESKVLSGLMKSAMTKSFSTWEEAGQYGKQPNDGTASFVRWSEQNQLADDALSFVENKQATPAEAMQMLQRIAPRMANMTSVNLNFFGDHIFYQGKWQDPVAAFQNALARTITRKKNPKLKDSPYNVNKEEFNRFLRTFIASHRMINGESVAMDVNGNATSIRMKSNNYTITKRKVNKEWRKKNAGLPNKLHLLLNLSEEQVQNPETIGNRNLRYIVENGMQLGLMGGVNNQVNDNQASYKKLNGEDFMMVNLLTFASNFTNVDKEGKMKDTFYDQVTNIHGNSSQNLSMKMPVTNYVVNKDGRIVPNNDPAANSMWAEFMNYFKNPEDKKVVGESVQAEVDLHIELMENLPTEMKKSKSLQKYFNKNTGQVSDYGKMMLQNYVRNYFVNQQTVQKMIFGNDPDFSQSKNFDLISYIKRAKGMMSSGHQISPNGKMEVLPVAFPEVEGLNIVDGDQFVLEEQVNAWKSEYGENGTITQNQKLIYDGKFRDKDGDENHVQLKSMTFVLTDNMVKRHPHLVNLREAMRKRYKEQSAIHGPDYVIIAGTMDTIKIGGKLKSKALDLSKYDRKKAPNIVEDSISILDDVYGPVGESTFMDGGYLRLIQNSDIVKNSVSVPIQFLSALYSHALPNTDYKNKIDNASRLMNNYRRNLLKKEILDTLGEDVTKDQIAEISKWLNDKILKSDADELVKSFAQFANINLPQIAEAQLNGLAKKFLQLGLKPKEAGTMGLHATEYGRYFLRKKENVAFKDTLKAPEVKDGKIQPGEIVLPWNMHDKVNPDQVVFVSRVPSHGVQTTVPMKVVGFGQKKDGSRIMTNSFYTNIMGGDHDGDHLYINTPSKNNNDYNAWFNAVEEILLDGNMWENFTAEISDKALAQEVLGDKLVPKDQRYKNAFARQFSPSLQSEVFAENMNQSIGTVATLNRLGFILRAENVKLKMPINVGGKVLTEFKNRENDAGKNSVAYQGQQLLQVVLDNPNSHYATQMNITPETSAMYALLVNMGATVKEVYEYFNRPGTKAYIKAARYHNGAFSKKGYMADIEKTAINILQNDRSLSHLQQLEAKANLEEVIHLESMVSELFDLNKVLSQHNKFMANPHQLNKAVKQFGVLAKGDSKYFDNLEAFANNPEVSHYLNVSKMYLDVVDQISMSSSAYHKDVYSIVANSFKYNNFENSKYSKATEKAIQAMISSHLIGGVTESRKELENIQKRLGDRIAILKAQSIENPGQRNESANMFLNMIDVSPYGIYPRHDMRDTASLNRNVINAAREGFKNLPANVQRDLVLYDLLRTGFTGSNTLSVFFSEELIQQMSDNTKTIIENKSLDTDSEGHQTLVKKALTFLATSEDAMPTHYVNRDDVVSSKQGKDLVSFNSESPNIDRRKYYSEQKGIFQNEPFIVKSKNKNGSLPVMLLYKPMPKEIHNAFMTEYSQAKTNKLRWEVFKEYMDQMNFEVLATGQMEFTSRMIDLVRNNNRPFSPGQKQGPKKLGSPNRLVKPKKKGLSVRAKKTTGNYFDKDVNKIYTQEEFFDMHEGSSNIANKVAYKKYVKAHKKYAKKAAEFLKKDLSKYSTAELQAISVKAMHDSYLASAQFTNILNREIAKRAIQKQTKLTGASSANESRDINSAFKWMGSENVSEKNPHLQTIYKTFNEELNKWEDEIKPEVEQINDVTKALIEDKFKDAPWWKKLFWKTIGGRKFYEKLYSNLVVQVTKNENGTTYYEYELINEKEEGQRNLSQAERLYSSRYR